MNVYILFRILLWSVLMVAFGAQAVAASAASTMAVMMLGTLCTFTLLIFELAADFSSPDERSQTTRS